MTEFKRKEENRTKLFCTYDGCDKYFYAKWHFDRHIRKHCGEKPFVCMNDDCDKAFTCRSYLNKHLKTHDNPNKKTRVRKTYECPECKHVFKQKYNLKVHSYQHTGEKPFKCEQCDRAYPSASKLRKHVKTHKGYACNRENCDFVASKWTELQKHVASEHKETYKCTQCDKQFNERYNLTRHLKIHSGERLVCQFDGKCKKSYSNERNLKAHIRIDHEGVRFSCDQCSQTFKYKGSLTKHINKKHKKQKEQVKAKSKPIYTHRVSYASKLTGVECCEDELKKLLLDDKEYRKTGLSL